MLAVALVLLVIVVGLTLMQRRAPTDASGTRPLPPPPTPPRRSPPPSPAVPVPSARIDDAELGSLEFDGFDAWETDAFAFDGRPVLLEVTGDRSGPSSAARAMAIAARSVPDLIARATALVTAELRRRGEPDPDVEIQQIVVETSPSAGLAGYVWFASATLDGEIGVYSTDDWRTLTLEVIE